jgi:hypothetical protein
MRPHVADDLLGASPARLRRASGQQQGDLVATHPAHHVALP